MSTHDWVMSQAVLHTREKALLKVVLIELRCAFETMALLIRGRLSLPRGWVGREVRFGDGSKSRVYRETVLRDRGSVPEVMLVVRFRLRFIGTSRLGHALFRFESLFNTLLFAAHTGFHTKLWLTDLDTGFYRGIYEWQDRGSAVEYAETLRVVLAPWAQDGSFAFQVIETTRDEFFSGHETGRVGTSSNEWWLAKPQRDETIG